MAGSELNVSALEFKAAVRGDLKAWAAKQAKAIDGAVASVYRRRINSGKKGVRRLIERAELGGKLANAFRGVLKTAQGRNITRTGDSSEVIGRLYSKAIKKQRPGGTVDLITVFSEGTVVRAVNGTWLAVPNKGIVPSRAKPRDYEGQLQFIRARGTRRGKRRALLVFKHMMQVRSARGGGAGPIPRQAIAFWLSDANKIKRRFRVQPVFDRTSRGLDDLVAREVERRVTRAAGKFFGE